VSFYRLQSGDPNTFGGQGKTSDNRVKRCAIRRLLRATSGRWEMSGQSALNSDIRRRLRVQVSRTLELVPSRETGNRHLKSSLRKSKSNWIATHIDLPLPAPALNARFPLAKWQAKMGSSRRGILSLSKSPYSPSPVSTTSEREREEKTRPHEAREP